MWPCCWLRPFHNIWTYRLCVPYIAADCRSVQPTRGDDASFLHHEPQPNRRTDRCPCSRTRNSDLIETVGKHWRSGSQPFRVTLFEQRMGRVGRILTIVTITKGPSVFEKLLNRVWSAFAGKSNSKVLSNADNMAIDIHEWGYSYISGTIQDRDAKILDTLAQVLPKAIKSFTLNFPSLMEWGPASVQGVLHQARLDHLKIK